MINTDVPDANVGDTISRQAAIDAVAELVSSMSICISIDECHGMKRMQSSAIRALNNLPSMERKKGTWICSDKKYKYAICSQCNWNSGEQWHFAKNEYKFCPNCGVKMEVINND